MLIEKGVNEMAASKSKWIGLILLVFVVILSACSSSNNKNAPSPSSNSSAAPKDNEATENSNFNPTGYPIVNDKVTLNFVGAKGAVSKDFDGLPFFDMVEKETNVHINWQLSPDTSWAEKKNLIFASGELPDAFYGHTLLANTDVLKYGSQGLLIPLEDLIDKYAPNIKKIFEQYPEYKKELTAPDGHIYSLPSIDAAYPDSRDALFINKKWLDQLGLDIPTTTDEFYNVLKAFKENDMNNNGKADEIPFSYNHHQNEGIYSFFGAFGLTDVVDHIVMRGDTVLYSAVQPEYKEAITYFNKLYSEGLIDEESLTHDTNVYFSKIKNPEVTVGAFSAWYTEHIFGAEPHDYVLMLPLKGPEGHQLWNRYSVGILSKGAFAITSANKHPEITMRWIDYSYDPLIGRQAVDGMFGINLQLNDDGTIISLDPPAGMNANEFRHSTTAGSKSVFYRSLDTAITSVPVPGNVPKSEIDKLYQPYLVENIYPQLFFTAEEDDQRIKYFTDIDAYASKMAASWMLRGGIEKEWDAYVETLNNMGLEAMMDIYQTAYDRYNETN